MAIIGERNQLFRGIELEKRQVSENEDKKSAQILDSTGAVVENDQKEVPNAKDKNLKISDSSGAIAVDRQEDIPENGPAPKTSHSIGTKSKEEPKDKIPESKLPELTISGSTAPIVFTKDDSKEQKGGKLEASNGVSIPTAQNSGGTGSTIVVPPKKLPPLAASGGVPLPPMPLSGEPQTETSADSNSSTTASDTENNDSTDPDELPPLIVSEGPPLPLSGEPKTETSGDSNSSTTASDTENSDPDELPPLIVSDGIPDKEIPSIVAEKNGLLNSTERKLYKEEIDFCWKSHYPRGAGKVPNHCPQNTTRKGLLCHDNCKPGYKGVGFVCWKDCPIGYHNDPMTCRSTNPLHITRREHYRRGVGKPMICPPDREFKRGLCYKKCKKGYTGIATVCWAPCTDPAMPFNCGASCAKNALRCGGGIFDMVFSTSELIANIVMVVITLGAWNAAKPAIEAAALSAKFTVAELQAAKWAVKKHLFKKMIGGTLGIKERLMFRTLDEVIGSALSGKPFEWGRLDPTGVRAVVKAFKRPICKIEV